MLLRFRTRSPARDKQSDAVRISSVKAAIASALASAERELAGLGRRRHAVQTDAALLSGNDADDCEGREVETESLITKAEAELVAAERRDRKLREHIKQLQQIAEMAEKLD